MRALDLYHAHFRRCGLRSPRGFAIATAFLARPTQNVAHARADRCSSKICSRFTTASRSASGPVKRFFKKRTPREISPVSPRLSASDRVANGLHVQHVSARAATCGVPQPSGERRQTLASMYVPAFGSVSTMRTLYVRKCALTQAEIVVQSKIDVFIGGSLSSHRRRAARCSSTQMNHRISARPRNVVGIVRAARHARKARRQFYERSALQQRT